ARPRDAIAASRSASLMRTLRARSSSPMLRFTGLILRQRRAPRPDPSESSRRSRLHLRVMAKKKRPVAEPAPYVTPLFDAHTHLASCGARDAESIAALMDRAMAAGVAGVCTIGDGLEETRL